MTRSAASQRPRAADTFDPDDRHVNADASPAMPPRSRTHEPPGSSGANLPSRDAASRLRPQKSRRRVERRPDSPWITAKEAADYLGVGVQQIYIACARRGLKHIKVGRAVIRLQRQWLDDWTAAIAQSNT